MIMSLRVFEKQSAVNCDTLLKNQTAKSVGRRTDFPQEEIKSNERMLGMEKFNGTLGDGSTLFNRLGWFIGLNLAWLLLAVLTVWLGWRSYTLSTSGSVAEGTVVRLLEEGVDFDSDFYPVVEFQVDSKTYTVQSQNNYRWWNRYTRFPVGRQVEVRYETAHPENAEINTWWDVWNETIILGMFTIFAAISVNVYLLFRWRSQRVAAVRAG
jgi:hypothetical protein